MKKPGRISIHQCCLHRSQATNSLVGSHFPQKVRPPTYWPATAHRHYAQQPSQVACGDLSTDHSRALRACLAALSRDVNVLSSASNFQPPVTEHWALPVSGTRPLFVQPQPDLWWKKCCRLSDPTTHINITAIKRIRTRWWRQERQGCYLLVETVYSGWWLTSDWCWVELKALVGLWRHLLSNHPDNRYTTWYVLHVQCFSKQCAISGLADVVHSTQHNIGQIGDVLPSQSLGLVLKFN